MKPSFSALENLSLRRLPDDLASLFRSGARRDLLAGVDLSLLLFERRLINTANGEWRELPEEDEAGPAAAIARAARAHVQGGRASPNILLLLPPTDFVVTSFEMAISGEKLIRSALKLQAHTLLPAYDDKLLLGVDARHSQGAALWFPAGRADALFSAFQEEGLFLSAIMPRSLALAAGDSDERAMLLHDEDASNISLMLVRNGAIRRFLTVSKRDLELEPFAQQWQEAAAELAADVEPQAEGRLPAQLSRRASRLDDWTGLRQRVAAVPAYSFLPMGSLQLSRSLEKVRRRRLGTRVALGAVALLFIPFLANWLQIMSLERRVEIFRVESQQARELQNAVFSMEQEWGAVSDYPDQDVAAVLLNLNQVIQNSLTSFTLDKGQIDILGYSQDPGALVAQLAQREEFINVAQSRNITGGNSSARGYLFGIRMGLRSADFEEYESQYPLVNE